MLGCGVACDLAFGVKLGANPESQPCDPVTLASSSVLRVAENLDQAAVRALIARELSSSSSFYSSFLVEEDGNMASCAYLSLTPVVL